MRSTSRLVMLCVAGFAAAAVDGTYSANARPGRGESRSEARPAGTPRLAVIALAQQRVSVYSAAGKIMEGPVSTGAQGRETPAGIYSILEKEVDHRSNLYDDASMPFMQRLTWTGIAMHAGHLPGYPASHGCTRLPYGFAQQLYQVTKLGMRVVIVREAITPADIEQPEVFSQASQVSPSGPGSPNEAEISARLQAVKEKKAAEAQAAKKREEETRSAAAKNAAQAAAALSSAGKAEANLRRLEAELNGSEPAPRTISSAAEKDDARRSAAAAKIQAARLQFEAVRALAQAKIAAAAQANEEAKAAAAASAEAAEAAELARQNAWPVSILVSRKTQRVYVRRGREPVFEGPVTIRDPDKPIGAFVFTAMAYTENAGRMRWNVVSMYKNATHIEPYSETKHGSKKQRAAQPADVAGARNALQRLVISQEAADHISGLLLPGSSLIISDEGLSKETGKDTDFVLLMSGEPQGGIASRAAPAARQDASRRLKRRTASSPSRFRHPATVWSRQGYYQFPGFYGF